MAEKSGVKPLVWTFVVMGGLSVLLGGLFLLSPPGCSQKASNERNASYGLKTIASAQADFRGNDRDGNKIQDFWRGDVSGLYGARPAATEEMIKLIEISVAGADAAPLDGGPALVARDQYVVFAPKAGYWYRALCHDDEDPDALDRQRFAACAYPAFYPKSGRRTYILGEGHTIYQRDTGGRPPDVFPDPESLKRDWAPLD
jgi:hypothetical protein